MHTLTANDIVRNHISTIRDALDSGDTDKAIHYLQAARALAKLPADRELLHHLANQIQVAIMGIGA